MHSITTQKSGLSLARITGFCVAMVFMLVSIVVLSLKGLNFDLDFTGGYLTEFTTNTAVTEKDMNRQLSSVLPGEYKLTSAENGTLWIVRQPDNATSLQGKAWLENFAEKTGYVITPQDAIYIGSQVGDELINQGGLALMTALIMILVYLSMRFEWRLAAGSILALLHDVMLVLGVFAWFGIPFDLTVLASLLAIIGYSLNDSIIVGDKVREMMRQKMDVSIDDMINLAIKATMVRTLVTSGTTLVTILSVWLFAGESLKGFSIALFVGILVGTLSSIAISATLPQFLGLKADYYHQKDEELCDLP